MTMGIPTITGIPMTTITDLASGIITTIRK